MNQRDVGGPVGGLQSVTGVTLMKWYSWSGFNYSQPSVPTLTSGDSRQLGSAGSVLFGLS